MVMIQRLWRVGMLSQGISAPSLRVLLLVCSCCCRVNMYSSFYMAVRGKKDS